jgi:hypothetical protein
LKTLTPKSERKSRRTDRFVFFLLRAQATLLNYLIRDEEEEKEDTERLFLIFGFMDRDNNDRPGVEHGKSFFLGYATMLMCFFVWFRY